MANKEGRKKVCGFFAAKICGDFGREEGEVKGDERRYDLIKGSLLPSRDFLSRPINESNFSSDFRLLRGFSADSIL